MVRRGGGMNPGALEPATEKVSEMVSDNENLVFNMTLDEVSIKRFAKNNWDLCRKCSQGTEDIAGEFND